MTQVLKNRKGVTLVELLAVIVIMGIIAAIAVPAIGGLIENSRIRAIEGTVTSMQEAARIYAITNENSGSSAAPLDVKATLSPSYIDLADYTITGITFYVTSGTVTFTIADGATIGYGGNTYTYTLATTKWAES